MLRASAGVCAAFASAGRAWPDHRPDHGPYPTRTVTIVVPFPPGGVTDVATRIVASQLEGRWKQGVVIENRAGAAGSVGAASVFGAAPDGYTLLSASAGPFAINPALFQNLPYSPREFVPAALLANVPTVLAASSARPIGSVGELIGFAKANPEKLQYAGAGTASISQLSGLLFQQATGTRLSYVPFRSFPEAALEVSTGRIDLLFDIAAAVLPLYRNGKVKILGVGSERRLRLLPEIPTLAELGLNNAAAGSWVGLVAPPKTDLLTAEHINWAVKDILAMPEVQSRYAELGIEPRPIRPEEFASFVATEANRFAAIIREAGIRPN
jgi:tripartite-type tricarboxylate transporter receptor subunit TctC